jgi:hypothetical protein
MSPSVLILNDGRLITHRLIGLRRGGVRDLSRGNDDKPMNRELHEGLMAPIAKVSEQNVL